MTSIQVDPQPDSPQWNVAALPWLLAKFEQIDPVLEESRLAGGEKITEDQAPLCKAWINPPRGTNLSRISLTQPYDPAALAPAEFANATFEFVPLRRSSPYIGVLPSFYVRLDRLAQAAISSPEDGNNRKIIGWYRQYQELTDCCVNLQVLIELNIGFFQPETAQEWFAQAGQRLIRSIHGIADNDSRPLSIQRIEEGLRTIGALNVEEIFAGQPREFIDQATGFVAYITDFFNVIIEARTKLPAALLRPEAPSQTD